MRVRGLEGREEGCGKVALFFFEVGKRSGLKKGVGASWRQEASATTFLIPSFPLFRSPSLQHSTHRAPAELPPRSQKASVSLLSWKTPRRAILSKAEKEGCRRRLERSNRNLIRPSLSFTLGQLSRLLRARDRGRRSESLLLSLLLLRSTSTRSGQGSLRFREKEKSEGKSEVEKEKKSKNHSEKSLGCYLEKQKRHSLFIRLFSRRSLAH